MTSLVPRPAYSKDELNNLYPEDLELRLVQVLLRHGERAPVSVRFGNVRDIHTHRSSVSLTHFAGRTPPVLAILQRRSTHTVRCLDPGRYQSMEFSSVEKKTRNLWER